MNEEFEIRIKGEKEEYKIKKGLPININKSKKAFGNCEEPVIVYIDYSAFKEMISHSFSVTDREVGGFLIGDVYEEKDKIIVHVKNIVKALNAVEKAASIKITEKAWQYILNVMDEKYKDQAIVGWYHTHPGYGVFYSGHDDFAHKNFFKNKWQVGIVVEPIKKDFGIFYWENDNLLKATRSFVLVNNAKKSLKRANDIKELLNLTLKVKPEKLKIGKKPLTSFSLIVISTVLMLIFAFAVYKKISPGSPKEKTDNVNLMWKYETGGNVFTLPAIDNGKVYAGSWDNYIYCLNEKDGVLVWKYKTGGEVNSVPLVYENMVYIGSDDDYLYCLNAENGELIWKFKTEKEVRTFPVTIDEKVYFSSNDGLLYCLSLNDGTLLWKYNIGGNWKSAPLIYDKRVYIGADKFYCLDTDTGKVIWDYDVTCINPYVVRPVINNGKVYFGGVVYPENKAYPYVYCLDIDNGNLVWSNPSDGWASFQYLSEQKLFMVTDNLENGAFNSWLYCFDLENGDVISKQNFWTRNPLCLNMTGATLYFESYPDSIVSLSAVNGKISQVYKIESEIGPIFIENGKMYFGSGSGDSSIYCVDIGEQ